MEVDRMPAEVQDEFRRFKRGMSPTHLLIAEWIIQNPGGTYEEMGGFFNYSPAWLCTLCNSDMFKAHIASRVKDIQAVTTQDIPEKMRVLATLAIEKQTEALKKTSDPELVNDMFDKVMHRYGYAPNAKTGLHPQGPAVDARGANNVFFLNREEFQRVQGRLIEAHVDKPAQSQLPAPVKEDAERTAPADSEKV